MKILVLNAGSSSIKYQLFEMNDNRVLASGLIEKIGESDSLAKIKYTDNAGSEQKIEREGSIKNHDVALGIISALLIESSVIHDLNELGGIGHRVVQGVRPDLGLAVLGATEDGTRHNRRETPRDASRPFQDPGRPRRRTRPGAHGAGGP